MTNKKVRKSKKRTTKGTELAENRKGRTIYMEPGLEYELGINQGS